MMRLRYILFFCALIPLLQARAAFEALPPFAEEHLIRPLQTAMAAQLEALAKTLSDPSKLKDLLARVRTPQDPAQLDEQIRQRQREWDVLQRRHTTITRLPGSASELRSRLSRTQTALRLAGRNVRELNKKMGKYPASHPTLSFPEEGTGNWEVLVSLAKVRGSNRKADKETRTKLKKQLTDYQTEHLNKIMHWVKLHLEFGENQSTVDRCRAELPVLEASAALATAEEALKSAQKKRANFAAVSHHDLAIAELILRLRDQHKALLSSERERFLNTLNTMPELKHKETEKRLASLVSVLFRDLNSYFGAQRELTVDADSSEYFTQERAKILLNLERQLYENYVQAVLTIAAAYPNSSDWGHAWTGEGVKALKWVFSQITDYWWFILLFGSGSGYHWFVSDEQAGNILDVTEALLEPSCWNVCIGMGALVGLISFAFDRVGKVKGNLLEQRIATTLLAQQQLTLAFSQPTDQQGVWLRQLYPGGIDFQHISTLHENHCAGMLGNLESPSGRWPGVSDP